MHDYTALFGRGLGVEVHSDLKSAGDAVVGHELESELVGEFCLNAVCDLLGILVVASSAAVVDEDVVFGVFFAQELW